MCFIYKESKSKGKDSGETLDLVALLVAISKCLSERISEEKGVSLTEAENIVLDCVKDGMKTIDV